MLSSIYFFALYNIFLCSTSLCFCVQKDFYNVHVYTDAFFFFFFRNISISFTNIYLLFDFFLQKILIPFASLFSKTFIRFSNKNQLTCLYRSKKNVGLVCLYAFKNYSKLLKITESHPN